MQQSSFEAYAHGKLMLTGEYAVMHGASALALATRYGQHLCAIPSTHKNSLQWTARDTDGTVWLHVELKGRLLQATNSSPELKILQNLLHKAAELNPFFDPLGWNVETSLEFSRHWGLGSSSTLVALIAQWAECNAFDLFFETLSGSGYDVAVALHGKHLIYRLEKPKPYIEPLDYKIPDSDSIRFVYLGKKQSSYSEIQRTKFQTPDFSLIADVDAITHEISKATKASDFDYLISIHEDLISRMIGIPPIQQQLFKEYPYIVKSLGAWGGDFVLARISSKSDENYFASKGYKIILSADDIIF